MTLRNQHIQKKEPYLKKSSLSISKLRFTFKGKLMPSLGKNLGAHGPSVRTTFLALYSPCDVTMVTSEPGRIPVTSSPSLNSPPYFTNRVCNQTLKNAQDHRYTLNVYTLYMLFNEHIKLNTLN